MTRHREKDIPGKFRRVVEWLSEHPDFWGHQTFFGLRRSARVTLFCNDDPDAFLLTTEATLNEMARRGLFPSKRCDDTIYADY